MKEGVSITFEPDVATGFKAAGQSILQDTVTFAGFQHIRVVQHEADVNRLRFIERWYSLDATTAILRGARRPERSKPSSKLPITPRLTSGRI